VFLRSRLSNFTLAEEVLDETVKATLTQSFAQDETQSSDGVIVRYERLANELEKNWAVYPAREEIANTGVEANHHTKATRMIKYQCALVPKDPARPDDV